jgi:ABC-type glutathione transport system ATPase component
VLLFSIVVRTDMESIDALAKAINEFKGGMVLVSHDMRLISQVANELWICDKKTITQYKDDIHSFKQKMRASMGLTGNQVGQLRGDASVKKKDPPKEAPAKKKAPAPTLGVILPKPAPKKTLAPIVEISKPKPATDVVEVTEPKPAALEPIKPKSVADDATTSTSNSSVSAESSGPTTSTSSVAAESSGPPRSKYVPPHLRRKLQQ